MFCDNCGREIGADQKFCRYCGFKLDNAEDFHVSKQDPAPSRIVPDADRQQVLLVKIMEKGEEKKNNRNIALAGIFFAILFFIAAFNADSGWIFGILGAGNIALTLYGLSRYRKCENEENDLKNKLC